MKIPIVLTAALAMSALTACDQREQSQSVPTTGASPLVSTQRHFFIASEEIQNPQALIRGGTVRVQPDPVVPHGAMPTLEIQVQLPGSTPFAASSIQEVYYFKGYAMGFLDAVFKRLICRSNAGDRLRPGWEQGWSDGYTSATNKPSA